MPREYSTANAGEFAGLRLDEGDERILKRLSQTGALVGQFDYDYPHVGDVTVTSSLKRRRNSLSTSIVAKIRQA
jgi:hypothetical protein